MEFDADVELELTLPPLTPVLGEVALIFEHDCRSLCEGWAAIACPSKVHLELSPALAKLYIYFSLSSGVQNEKAP